MPKTEKPAEAKREEIKSDEKVEITEELKNERIEEKKKKREEAVLGGGESRPESSGREKKEEKISSQKEVKNTEKDTKKQISDKKGLINPGQKVNL